MPNNPTNLANIDAEQWNALVKDGNPFQSHEFLLGLEQSGSLLAENGWQPQHMSVFEDDKLQAASALYLKHNSHGEFVFDWAWADAYQRNGLAYYPKLLCAAPYSPVPGPRLLACNDEFRRRLIDQTVAYATDLGISTVHWNFINEAESKILDAHFPEVLSRFQWQYHWHNRDYTHFDDFLAQLKAKKRKNIRQERTKVLKSGVAMRTVSGNELSAEELHFVFRMYQATFLQKGNHPALTQAFFELLAQKLGQKLIVVIASHNNQDLAAAVFLRSETTLYGRYWGSLYDIPGLHFEACYYQGIEYCIAQGLQTFEPGAQGEHKIARGFVPVKTYSRHWVANEQFRHAIARHLEQENAWTEDYGLQLREMSPYRS